MMVNAFPVRWEFLGQKNRFDPGAYPSDDWSLAWAAEQQAENEQHQEDEEQHLRDSRGGDVNPAEAKDRRNQGDHEKYGSPVQHVFTLPA
jgi:hypothetical protein